MNPRIHLLACLLPAALAGSACEIGISAGGVEGTFDRDLTVSGPVELEVTSGSGDIQVRTGPDGAIHVHGRVRASSGPWVSLSGQSAEQRVRQIENDPPIEQSNNRVEIGPKRWSDGWNGVSIGYEITVPANTRVAARSGSGDLQVADVAGPVEASTGSGDIRVGRVEDDVTARTGSGDIDLVGAASARMSTGSGNVTAAGIRGDLDARSGSGDITVGQQGKGSADVSTGSGDVRLRLPSQGGFDLDLRSSSGRIETSIPITITGTQSRREIRGQVRGGGPRVMVSTSSGSITIQ